jgi:flagellar FliL protein
MKKPLILALAGVVLAGGGGAAFMMMGRGEHAPAEGEHAAADGHGGGGHGAHPAAGSAGVVQMDPFLVNINDPSGDRYVKVTLRLAVAPNELATKVGEDALLQARMRDRVLTLLTSKTVEELISPLGKEGFRREIQENLKPLIDKGEVQEVLFADFVVQ